MRNLMKPVGIFSADQHRPGWASFALLPDWADFTSAAAQSATTGVQWILGIYGIGRTTALAPLLPELVRRIDAAGLRQHLKGVVYHEEWNGAFLSGAQAIACLDPKDAKHWMPAAEAIKWWVGQQHAAIRSALPGVPVIWLDGFVNDDPSFGAWWYRPVPDGVDVLALEAYVPAGGSWAADVEPFLAHAVGSRKEPVVLVVQAFKDVKPGGLWSDGPTDESIRETRRWMSHPRVIAGWVFDWASRPGCLGMEDLPQRAALEQALGVQ